MSEEVFLESLIRNLALLNMRRASLERIAAMTPAKQIEAQEELEKEYQAFCEKHGFLPKQLADTNGRELWNDFVGRLKDE